MRYRKCQQQKDYEEAMKDNSTMEGYVKPADRVKKKAKRKVERKISFTDLVKESGYALTSREYAIATYFYYRCSKK